MKLIEALEILRRPPAADAQSLDVHLACGFMADRFQIFLAAHLRTLFPERRVAVETGLYGDCLGNPERMRTRTRPSDAGAAILEWSDFDPRLGIRGLGGWDPDTVRTAGDRADRLHEAMARAAGEIPLAVGLPSLPLSIGR